MKKPERLPSGRYAMAQMLEDKIPELYITEDAARYDVDPLPVAAMFLLQKKKEVEQFRYMIYPEEIAHEFFPEQPYSSLDLHVERMIDVGGMVTTPRMESVNRIKGAHDLMEMMFGGGKHAEYQKIRKRWDF